MASLRTTNRQWVSILFLLFVSAVAAALRPMPASGATPSAVTPFYPHPGPRTESVALGEYQFVRYVSKSGSDTSGDGSKEKPWATVLHATAQTTGTATTRIAILVSEGTYQSGLSIFDWVDMFGGFETGTWSRDLYLHPSILTDGVARLGNHSRIDGFTLAGSTDGLISASGKTSVTITNNIVTQGHKTQDSYGYSYGGGISAIQSSGLIARNVVASNSVYSHGARTAPAALGGGIAAGANGALRVEGNIVAFNTADLVVMGYSGGQGAGLAVWGGPTVTNNVFYRNDVLGDDGSGSAIYMDDGAGIVANNTILENTSSYYGALDARYEPRATIRNCIIRDNTKRQAGFDGYTINCNLINCDLNGVSPTTGCIDLAPLFDDDGFSGTFDAAVSTGSITVLHVTSPSALQVGILANRLISLAGVSTAVVTNTADTITIAAGQTAGSGQFQIHQTFHLSSESPCIDAGSNDGAPSADFDGDPRPMFGKKSSTADIGADEFSTGPIPTLTPTITPTATLTPTPTLTRTPTSTPIPGPPPYPRPGPRTEPVSLRDYQFVRYVSKSGSDTSGDGSKQKPWATVLHAASLTTGTATTRIAILVSEGTYQSGLSIFDWVDMLGGFETGTWSRNLFLHPSILTGGVARLGNHSRIDGFTLSGSTDGLISCVSKTSVTMTNNIVAQGHKSDGSEWIADGAGILFYNSSGLVARNVVASNSIYTHGGRSAPGAEGGGIYAGANGSVVVDGNIVAFNTVDSQAMGFSGGNGAGLFTWGGPTVTNNLFYRNQTMGYDGYGSAIYVEDAIGIVANNTVLENTSLNNAAVGTIYTGMTIRNCIIRDNIKLQTSFDGHAINCNISGASPTSGCIDLAPLFYDDGFTGTFDGAISTGSITVLHLTSPSTLKAGALANRLISIPGVSTAVVTNTADTITIAAGQSVLSGQFQIHQTFHLGSGSPCIDAGTNDGAPSVDMDGDPRPMLGKTSRTADIGADEFAPSVIPTLTPTATPVLTATPTPTPTATPFAVYSSVLSFDGGDYVAAGDGLTTSLVGQKSFTIEAWVKRASSAGYDIVVGHGSGDKIGWDLQRMRFGYGPGRSFIFANFANADNLLVSLPVSADGDVGQWHHWAATFQSNGRTARLYRDGMLVGSTVFQNDYVAPGGFFIGRSSGSDTGGMPDWFNGQIAEVRVWDHVLTQGTILANLHASLSGNETGLVGYWRFDEGSGQVAHDSSPRANDGRLGSSPQSDNNDPAWALSDVPVLGRLESGITPTPSPTPTRTPTPTPTQVPLASNLSRTGYAFVGNDLRAEKTVYVDRDYVFKDPIPSALRKKTYIRTANNDRDVATSAFLSFRLNAAADIYVALDQRIAGVPAWMVGWRKVSSSLVTTDPAAGRDLYMKHFDKGTVTLGPNRTSGMPTGRSMYSVVIVEWVAGVGDWTIYGQ